VKSKSLRLQLWTAGPNVASSGQPEKSITLQGCEFVLRRRKYYHGIPGNQSVSKTSSTF
jgi:hypothetical protein